MGGMKVITFIALFLICMEKHYTSAVFYFLFLTNLLSSTKQQNPLAAALFCHGHAMLFAQWQWVEWTMDDGVRKESVWWNSGIRVQSSSMDFFFNICD